MIIALSAEQNKLRREPRTPPLLLGRVSAHWLWLAKRNLAQVEGIRELLEQRGLKIHCQADEAEWIMRSTGVSDGDLSTAGSGDELLVGELPIRFIHTPGHTPRSQCFLVGERFIAGDTLFLEGSGRTDFPGGDREEMFKSLHRRLAALPDDTVLYSAHLYYDDRSAALGDVRRTNFLFRMKTLQDWLGFMP